MDFKNPNINDPKKVKERTLTLKSRYINILKRKAWNIKSRTNLEVRDKQKSHMTKEQVIIGHKFTENS